MSKQVTELKRGMQSILGDHITAELMESARELQEVNGWSEVEVLNYLEEVTSKKEVKEAYNARFGEEVDGANNDPVIAKELGEGYYTALADRIRIHREGEAVKGWIIDLTLTDCDQSTYLRTEYIRNDVVPVEIWGRALTRFFGIKDSIKFTDLLKMLKTETFYVEVKQNGLYLNLKPLKMNPYDSAGGLNATYEEL